MDNIGPLLKSLRVKAGLFQKDIATPLGYKSSHFIAAWEAGTTVPPLKVIPKLAAIYGRDPVWLYGIVSEVMVHRYAKSLYVKWCKVRGGT